MHYKNYAYFVYTPTTKDPIWQFHDNIFKNSKLSMENKEKQLFLSVSFIGTP